MFKNVKFLMKNFFFSKNTFKKDLIYFFFFAKSTWNTGTKFVQQANKISYKLFQG